MSNYEFIGGPFGFSGSKKPSSESKDPADHEPNNSDGNSNSKPEHNPVSDTQAGPPTIRDKAAAHRINIAKLILATQAVSSFNSTDKRAQPTLCVLGAGPCIDLSFEMLLPQLSHITLVDLNGALVKKAVSKLKLDKSDQISIVGDLDVTGVSELLSQMGEAPSEELFEQIKSVGSKFRAPQLGQFDIVVSTCLISQLNNHAFNNVKDEAKLVELLGLIRKWHLEFMLSLANENGCALLVTDLTSSWAMPELDYEDFLLTDEAWSAVLNGNHFHGMSPKLIVHELKTLQQSGAIQKVQTTHPWIWVASDRRYACIGYFMHK